MEAKQGDTFKVKRTPLLREFGVRVHGSISGAADCKAWPGEIGTVTLREWVAWDGSPNSALMMEFSRGRAASMSGLDASDFLRVKAPVAESPST